MRAGVNVLRFGRLLRSGVLFNIPLAFAASVGAPPVLWLGDLGFRQLFAVGFCGSLALILARFAASRSWGGLVDIVDAAGADPKNVCLPDGSHEIRARSPAPNTLREGDAVLRRP